MFVTDIRPESNTVVLGAKEDLDKHHMWVRRPNFVKVAALKGDMEAVIKVRYKDKGTPGTLSMDGDPASPAGRRVRVEFHAPVTGIAPGQSAVFYDGEDVIGGGFIDREPPKP
jgi:tRNA-specific 2-thiouridylase